MPRKEPSAKQERAWAYNQANGKLKGMVTMLKQLRSELPYLDSRIEILLEDYIDDIWSLRQCIIDHQNKLIKEGK